MGDKVRYERHGKVGVIVLDHPPFNAYSAPFHADLQEAWEAGRDDPDANVLVMLGKNKHFCGGASMAATDHVPEARPHGAVDLFTLVKTIMKPTIAAVHGACLGGGQRFVFPCDMIFCSPDAYFRDPTVDFGIGGIQSHLHTWFYGPRLAREMIYTGDGIPAERLYAMGMVNRIIPREQLHDETMEVAAKIADKPALPLRQAKRASMITMDIMGQHYITSRFAELLDEAPVFNLPRS